MTLRERMLSVKLMEKMKNSPDYSEKLGISGNGILMSQSAAKNENSNIHKKANKNP